MPSVLAHKSQVAPFKFYATEAGATGLIYNEAGANGVEVAANRVLADMGKTVFLANGKILRKVQVLPVGAVGGDGAVGYIYLNDVPAGQNIVTLN